MVENPWAYPNWSNSGDGYLVWNIEFLTYTPRDFNRFEQ